MRKNASKPYRRLDRSERAAIERGLDKRKSCRQIARELRRSPSTVADEVARNRTVCRGPNKGGRAAEAPDDACPKLLSWLCFATLIFRFSRLIFFGFHVSRQGRTANFPNLRTCPS